jgi:hypothetical protein
MYTLQCWLVVSVAELLGSKVKATVSAVSSTKNQIPNYAQLKTNNNNSKDQKPFLSKGRPLKNSFAGFIELVFIASS